MVAARPQTADAASTMRAWSSGATRAFGPDGPGSGPFSGRPGRTIKTVPAPDTLLSGSRDVCRRVFAPWSAIARY